MPIAVFSLVALECVDPGALAAFYQAITGGEIVTEAPGGEWVRLDPPSGSSIGFQRDPNHRPPGWPDGSSQQAHLDFDVADLDRAERELLAVGAIKSSTQPAPDEWRVFIDPAGHPFCLVKV